jgi:hypothetical protein
MSIILHVSVKIDHMSTSIHTYLNISIVNVFILLFNVCNDGIKNGNYGPSRVDKRPSTYSKSALW